MMITRLMIDCNLVSPGSRALSYFPHATTAETTMNPIGQDIPVICLHLEDTTNNARRQKSGVVIDITVKH